MHFRTELSCEKTLNEEYRAVIESLDKFYQDVSRQIGDLEKALQQIDKYQHDIQLLKQKLVQEEQLLKTMTPEQPADNVQVRVCLLTHLLKPSHILTESKQLSIFYTRKVVLIRPLSLLYFYSCCVFG